ncbi:MAG: hypothetical protein GY938_10540 [Ketobacter sp.]|nr:hypothetical protein [Ketobacter sp.]
MEGYRSKEMISNISPKKPRLVTRIGFAGSCDAVNGEVKTLLTQVFQNCASFLKEYSPLAKPVSDFYLTYYDRQPPLLRLVTGLAEGADTLAWQVFQNLGDTSLNIELAAVLPASIDSYIATQDKTHHEVLGDMLQSCAYVQELDGVHIKPDYVECAQLRSEELKRIDQRRALSYRNQSEMLLRHTDILVAVVDIKSQVKAAGTFETIRNALEFNLPVVLVDSSSLHVQVLTSINELERAKLFGVEITDWLKLLQQQMRNIILGDNEHPSPPTGKDAVVVGGGFLNEFFASGSRWAGTLSGPGRTSLGERLWSLLEKHLQHSGEELQNLQTLEPFKTYRDRATSLNYHYSGCYRGTFLWNYVLAVLAVILAVTSLVMLAVMDSSATLYTWLISLAAIKLSIVSYIYKSTHMANNEEWNDKSVNYRYLAERMRVMYYLPKLGSFKLPTATPARYATKTVGQNAADWLFDAIVRSTSPLTVTDNKTAIVQPETVIMPDGRFIHEVMILRTDPLDAAQRICNEWVQEQAVYHRRVETSMRRLFTLCKEWGERLSKIVVWVVVADIILVLFKAIMHVSDDYQATLKLLGAVLILLTAVLPAVVATLNGIRFQSECRRMADRSDFIRRLLVGSATHRMQPDEDKGGFFASFTRLINAMQAARDNPLIDDGSWVMSVLSETELVAADLVVEVAEWSVLYAKEVPETG